MNGLQRIQSHFQNHKAFVGYLTAGDGGIQRTLEGALALIAGGVNLLEIGLPFSDPVADGPVIQQASARALAGGIDIDQIFWLTAEIRKVSQIPLILFSYLNPILSMLKASLFKKAQQAGLDGILIVDCPIEESHRFHQSCLDQGMAPIYIISPTTPLQRLQQINQLGKGFLYYACRKGTTGMQAKLPENFVEKIKWIKSQVQLPVVAGFGIAEKETAEYVLKFADGVVIGSLFVDALGQKKTPHELCALARNINPLR